MCVETASSTAVIEWLGCADHDVSQRMHNISMMRVIRFNLLSFTNFHNNIDTLEEMNETKESLNKPTNTEDGRAQLLHHLRAEVAVLRSGALPLLLNPVSAAWR